MKKNTVSLLSYIILILGFAATFMIIVPAMSFPDSDTAFNGFEIVFGTEFANLGDIVSGQIVGNAWGVLGYLLPLIACVTAVFIKKSALVSAVLFLVGAVLLLMLPEYVMTTVTIFNVTSEIEVEWVLSNGLIVASVCSAMGAMLCLFTVVRPLQSV